MKRDSIITLIIGAILIVAIVAVSNIKLRDAEPEETVRVTEAELETYTEPETTRVTTATLFLDTEVLTEECKDTGEVVDTSPEPTETRYLNVTPGDGYLDVPMERSVQDGVRAIADEYGVPFELVMAVCYVESGFDPYAISSHGDAGLMQIAPVNHEWVASDLGCTNLYDELQNVRAGTHILTDKIAGSGGDYTIALMKYNRGDAVALEQMRDGVYSTDYTDKVLGKYYEYLNYGG